LIFQEKVIHPFIAWQFWITSMAICLLLVMVAQFSFPVFHILIELFSVLISAIIFILTWYMRRYSKNNFLLFLACGYLWGGFIVLIHLLSYGGIGYFAANSAHMAMQFGGAAYFLQALALCAAPFAATKKQNGYLFVTVFGFISIGLSALILTGKLPNTFLEGNEYTSFKIYSGYLIELLLMLALWALLHAKSSLTKVEKTFIILAIVFTACSEFCFTFYNEQFSELFGHILKFFSFWLIFNVVIIANIKTPYTALQKNKESFKRLFDNSEVSIWNEDFSGVVQRLNKLRTQGVTDLKQYLQENKKLAWELASQVKVQQVNEATLKLFGASYQEEFLGRIHETFIADTIDIFIQAILAIWEDKQSFRAESTYKTLDNKEIDCIISFQIPDTLAGFQSVPVTLVDITHRKQNEARIWRQGNFDDLTGLVNRNLFSNRLSYALECGKRNQTKLAILYLDLDGFKHVNDTLGHLVGDELLQEASLRLLSHIRQSDTVARLGGDEFAILLPEISSKYDIEKVVNKIQTSIAEPYHIQGHDSFVSASIGITIFPDDGDNTVTLLRKADSAMYKAKKKGRNNFQFFTPEIDKEVMRRKELEEALHTALDNGDFFIYYQPVISLETEYIESAEALIRWQHAEKGVISPGEFIPLAEELGIIVQIGEWVLREACREAMTWSIRGKEPPSVAVNLSSRQFQSQNILQLVQLVLQETGLPANRLILEITESLLLADNNAILRQLHDIRRLGVRFSIDDFGTGYSSLSYLKKFPVDTLKIDRSFIKNLPTAQEDVALVNAMLSMAKSLGMNVVAEGVETEVQADFIKSTNCQYLQGYLYSKPLAKVDFIDYLMEYSAHKISSTRLRQVQYIN
jgi:diguanylate cyclase (GGDEF)-like protein